LFGSNEKRNKALNVGIRYVPQAEILTVMVAKKKQTTFLINHNGLLSVRASSAVFVTILELTSFN
jgi:hypothetical protein